VNPARRVGALLVVAVVATGGLPASIPPAGAQVVPGLSPRPRAGQVVVTRSAPRQPTAKAVDGDPSDWIGIRTGLAGTTLQSAGELLYEDFLFDGHGADDGLDALLAGVTGPIVGVVPELDRPLRQGPVLAGILTNGTLPGSRPMHIGDAATPPGRREAADLAEARIAPGEGGVFALVRTGQMRRADETAVLLLVDLDGAAGVAAHAVPFGSGLRTARAELAVLLTNAGVQIADLRSGTTSTGGSVAVRPDGDINAVEAFVPLPHGAEPHAIALATGHADAAGTGLVDVGPGTSPNIVNVAFRREPVSVAMDETQALVLLGGSIDSAFTSFDAAALRQGATQTAVPGPGYYEARFTSTTPGVATEDLPRQGALQSYGLYVPASWRPGELKPTTIWLHYGAGDTHHLGAFQPNLVRTLGEERGNLLVSPSGRGESTFFGGAAYADVLEALADSDRFGRDPDRTSLAGYSMGSYGTMLLTTLHPDLWAGALAVDGTPPSYHDGFTQNLANAAPVPFVLMGLLAYSQMRPDYEALRAAGATARLYLYPTDHYTNIVLDEWTQLTQALGQPVRDSTPERVRYTRVPAIESAVASGDLADAARVATNPAVVPVDADGAFWVDEIKVRSGDPASLGTIATVDATTDGRGHQRRTPVPELAVSLDGAATPYVMEGVRFADDGPPQPRADSFRAALTNVRSVRLDLTGMGLCEGATTVGTVTTDGPSTLVLDRTPGTEPIVVDLQTAGTHEVQAPCGEATTAPAPRAPSSGRRLPATGAAASPLVPALLLLAALLLLPRTQERR
jgi:pimeloyl-ACP methyl ester carboxylesterase